MNDFADINARFKDLMRRARVDMAERAVTECMTVANGYAAAITPQATGYLLNSQYRQVEITINGVRGEFGYGANYARYVHDAPGILAGQSRYPASDGVYWGPAGKPRFLSDGVMEMVYSDMERIMRDNFVI